MVSITLGKNSPEDFKQIQELQEMGVSDEIIQTAYENTERSREVSEIKLKPCPFCGGKAVLQGDFCSLVKCEKCGAESGMAKISKEYSSDEKAAAAWNRRADNDPNSSNSR